MGYQVLTFNYNIGDTGITQGDDGNGGTSVGINVSLIPPFGWTILNVVSVITSNPVDNPGLDVGPTVTPPSNDGGTPWTVSAGADYEGLSHPIAAATPVFQITVIAGN